MNKVFCSIVPQTGYGPFLPEPVRLGLKKKKETGRKPKQYSKTKSTRAGVAHLSRQAGDSFPFQNVVGSRVLRRKIKIDLPNINFRTRTVFSYLLSKRGVGGTEL